LICKKNDITVAVHYNNLKRVPDAGLYAAYPDPMARILSSRYNGKELEMKLKSIAGPSVALLSILVATVCLGAQEQPRASAFFPETSYEFAPVLDGDKVVHDFVIQNKGTTVLKVERVRTG
jgi:hypothetical protein